MGAGDWHRIARNYISAASKLARQFDWRRPADGLRAYSDGGHSVVPHRHHGLPDRSVRPPCPSQPGGGLMTDVLVIKGLSKRFGGLRAVQDLSFNVRENETLPLIGPNGAGKTTAFNLIMGYYRPDEGVVEAFGQNIVGVRPHAVCAHGVARTFQVAKPFGGMTVLATVMTGAFLRPRNPQAARDKARETIEFVGLATKEAFAARDLTTIDQRRLEMDPTTS